MQSATNRDEYVRIVFDKIRAGTEYNFDKSGADEITDYGIEYDYGSYDCLTHHFYTFY
jgi:Astacin (Peptidase family M12A)